MESPSLTLVTIPASTGIGFGGSAAYETADKVNSSANHVFLRMENGLAHVR